MDQEIQVDELLKTIGELYLRVRLAEKETLKLKAELAQAKTPAPPEPPKD